MATDTLPAEAVVVAPCELDIATGPLLAEQLATACSLQPARLIVDFSGVAFCDSTAIPVLLDAAAALRMHGGELRVREPDRYLRRIAHLLGLADALGVPPPDTPAVVDTDTTLVPSQQPPEDRQAFDRRAL